MGLLEYIDKLVTEHGSAAVLERHIAFIRERAEALEKQVADLKAENAALKERVCQLESKTSENSKLEDFIEHCGALFKRKPGGGYHAAVYCPRCKISTGTIGSVLYQHVIPYSCRCGWSSSFSAAKLDSILRELP